MANCGNCGKHFFISGADGEDGTKFCDERCQMEHQLQPYIDRISVADLDQEVQRLQDSKCPECNGPGPLEVWHSHSIWSALVLTRWVNQSHFCCKSCARTHQWQGLAISTLLGWWGFPWGVIMTPVQIVRGLNAVFTGFPEGDATPEFIRQAQLTLGARRQKEHRRRMKEKRQGTGTGTGTGTSRDASAGTATSPRPTRSSSGGTTRGGTPQADQSRKPPRKDSVADRGARLVDGDEVDDLEFL